MTTMTDRLPHSRPTVRTLGAVFALFVAVAGPVSAQAALFAGTGRTDAPAEAGPKPTAPEPIAAGDIPLRADADERFAQGVVQRAQGRDPSKKLGAELDALTAGIVKLAKVFDNEDLKQLAAIRLESLDNHWEFYQRELDRWRTRLDSTTSSYTEDAAELARRRGAWEATRQAMLTGGVTPALIDRVNVIIDQFTLAERALSRPLDEQLKLRRRANTVQSSIDAGRKGVDTAIAHYDRRLGMIDATPVWKAWNDTRFNAAELKGTEAGLRLETAFMEEWGAANQPRLRAYKFGALALLPLLLWLSRRSRRTATTEPSMQAAAKVLQRPISAWLLLTLIGVPFVFQDAPLVLHQTALLLALVPVLRLLPQRVFAVLGHWPVVGTILYLLYRLSIFLVGQPLHYRLYTLALALLTAAVLVWLLVSSKNRHERSGAPAPQGIVRAVAWGAVAALLTGIVANIVGNVSLAEVLTGAVLDSAYVGLALYAGANVVSSILSLLLARREMTRFRVITQHAGPLLASMNKLVMYTALTAWIVVTLNEFRVARPIFGAARAILTHPLEIGQISVTLGSILLFIVSVYVAFWVARTVRIVLRDEMLPKMDLPRGVGNSISSLSYYGLVLIGLLVALAAAGFETSQFALVFGALGIGIGLGLQNVVNNFVSGLILMFERPIQPGDVVEVSGTSGKVREIGMRATTLTTFEGADVVVPNGTLLSEKLINWTLSDMNRRIDVEVGVAYGSDPRRVLALLRDVALATPGITPEPAPAIVLKGFGPSSLDFGIRAWTNDFGDWVAIRTEMTARVYEALMQEGIEIPFPQQAVHIRNVSPASGRQSAGAMPPPDAPRST
ncbi:MAG: mechanosensitive ion channel [Proteobacteria bacterium]|nr:mechanosensitive ion channel [Pseudomonadota bacterium]MBP6105722.1 mechanosensitive ion channel [Steroidobacteraceae bacterium]MBP7013917.1 mechanosensitive ion channel [Steroidobacteraceae bacterium]